jgi:pyruvate formate lyase activating enzyme
MVVCKICKNEFDGSERLPVCINCIRNNFEQAMPFIEKAHATTRSHMGLPTFPPRDVEGLVCGICGNACRIAKGAVGFCGLTENIDGKLVREVGTESVGLVSAYKDPHVTNCVASPFCAGGTGAGYPKYAMVDGPEIGYINASIFLGTCSYHCLYCQNTSWHDMIIDKQPKMEAEELARWILADRKITCMCWFGGSPEPQIPFVWNVSRLVRKEAKSEGRILRVCLESSGNFSWKWLKKIAKISLESGGGIKFDLKAAKGSNVNISLSGVSNDVSYSNFEKLVEFHRQRPEVPFLRVSTLLVPHYIDLEEVKSIAKFVAGLDATIPYSLLAFYPHYLMTDLGFTSRKFAERCYKTSREAGLKNVRIGNIHLLR